MYRKLCETKMKNEESKNFLLYLKLKVGHHPPSACLSKGENKTRDSCSLKEIFQNKKNWKEQTIPDVKLQVERTMILVAKLQTERPRVIFYLEELLANLRTIFRNHLKVEIIFVIKIDIVHVVFINK